MMTVAACKVRIDPSPPPPANSIDRVSRPMATDQKIRRERWQSAIGSLRRLVKLPITSEPESALVT